ncbi:ABC transporter ATP-binding protein [Sediminispirochaeta bajacaliforniensis]|uniref:ABC transporter ATP-binding protein n=1 Tax=Sediminispirochaeta bajacaliforniensis TaxID=148 RepID=UPI00035C5ED8|nr:ABC transporter ATP-binding protein [Sediminispirochaeta bajacaliforniensis]
MIRISGMDFGYGKNHLFRGLNLNLKPGNIYGLLGKNGAGKTTLLQIMSGLLFPEAGEVLLLGREPAKRSPSLLAEIFFLAEDFHVNALTGEAYELLYAPFYERFDHHQFLSYLEEFDIPGNRKLTTFSYGQRKKFLLSFGLACNTSILFLDEPTNGLDIPSKNQFRRVLASAVDETKTIIISTHQVRDMGHLIDPIVIVDSGAIILNRTIAEIGRSLLMRYVRALPSDPAPIYSDQALGGYIVVEENKSGEEGSVDIEVFFNAVMTARERVEAALQRRAG